MSKKSYLAAVDKFFLDRPSGSARVAYDIACLMRDRGYDVTVFCRRQKSQDPDQSEHEGIRVVRFDYPATASLDPFKLYKQIAAGSEAARKHLSGRKWDIVHLHLAPHGQMVINALGPEQKYLYTAHSPMVDEQLANWADQGVSGKIKMLLGRNTLRKVELGVLRQVRRIHTLSNYTRQMLSQRYGLEDKYTVIPHWCRQDFFRTHSKTEARQKLNWPEDARIIFTVRRLAPRMGLDVAIEAIAPLLKQYPDVWFCLAGEGPLRQWLAERAESLGVSDRILFLGRISDQMLKLCYEAADLFILPTRALECFGLPVLEAMAFGLPLITTDAAAIPELMRPILPDCIIPAGSIGALHNKISDYLEKKISLPDSAKLVEYVSSNFGMEKITEQIVTFLKS